MSSSPGRTRPPLIRTRLSAPRLRANLVSRPRLLRLLDQGAARALTLVCAPAGYGKSTLILEWIAARQQAGAPGVSWLSLDPGDNDPALFLSYLVAAFENGNPQMGGEARALLASFPPAPLQTVLGALVNDLLAAPHPIRLVLDDYQAITNPAIHAGMAFFLERIPEGVHLILATRSDPPLPLARLRARDQLVEIRAVELRFTPEEASLFLNRAMGLSLSAQDMATLETRTEGWAAGLQMAALSLQGRADVSGFIQAFSGSHRYILDYLAEEALNRQPPEVQRFLAWTAVLDRMCAPLCDALLEDAHRSSHDMLAYLDQANLFLIALDDVRCWFRYHHLFVDLLRARLQQAEPGLTPRLHLRAAAWFEEQGHIVEAVQHSLAGLHPERAADGIERYGPGAWSAGDPSLLMLMGRLPPETLRARPKLSLYQAWMLISQGQAPAALPLMDALRRTLAAAPETPEQRWMMAFIDLLSLYTAAPTGEPGQAALPDYCALDGIPGEDLVLRNTADYLYAILLNRLGSFERAAEILRACIQRDQAAHGATAVSLAAPLLARIYMMEGRLSEAAALCLRYLEPGPGQSSPGLHSASALNIILGEVLYEWDDLEEAEKRIREGIQANEPWKNFIYDAIGYSDLASVQQARGDLAGAVETMHQLDGLLQGHSGTLDMAEEMVTIQVRLWMARGDWDRAEAWADQMALAEPRDYLQGWGYLTLARVRYAQGRYGEVQRILEALAQQPGAEKRPHRQIRVDLFLAIVLARQNRWEQALQKLEACLARAERGGYRRLFLDSGPPVQELLTRYLQPRYLRQDAGQQGAGRPSAGRQNTGQYKDYAQKMLDAFPAAAPSPASEVWVEPLTAREKEVLRLITQGLSNREIAEKLVLSEGTVKFHVHSILEKIDVHSRAQAVVKAKELGLV